MAASSDTLAIKASSAVVTLDVFSGKPNPTWPLSAAMTAEALRSLQKLEASKTETAEFDGLGYRAVRAELHDGTKVAALVSASRGVVTLDRGGQRSQYADAGRQFELWLVNTGAGQIPPDVLKYVAGEIAKPR